MTGLIVEGVSKVYKKKTALFPCSFAATEGTCVVLCGGNGAGKSTLLQIIAGVLYPTSGKTSINGRDITYEPRELFKRNWLHA